MLNLSKFNNNQQKAITHIDGACCVLAGAGSGKTSVITNRIAYLIEQGIEPSNILAVTFTKKASEEMKTRLKKLIKYDADDVVIGTFHSICYQIIKNEIPNRLELVKDWWSTKTITEIMSPPSNKFPYGVGLEMLPNEALSLISLQKNYLKNPDETLELPYALRRMENQINSMYKTYESLKKQNGFFDFDDMLVYAYKLFQESPKILDKYRKKFKYILCDEFQDTNVAQHEILKQLAGEHRNLFVVGDDYQGIYKFRGANLDIILNFEENWNAKVIPLDINYRCSGSIVELSNKLIKNNPRQCNKNVHANAPRKTPPRIMRFYDENEEAEEIALEIRELLDEGSKLDDFAILYRTNAQSRPFEEYLSDLDIPYAVMGSGSFFNRREIQDMVAYLRLVVDSSNDLAFKRVYNAPNRFLGKAFLEQLNYFANEHDKSLMDSLEGYGDALMWRNKRVYEIPSIVKKVQYDDLTPQEAIKYIRKATGYDHWLSSLGQGEGEETDERIEALKSFTSMAVKFSTIEDFLEHVDKLTSKNKENKVEKNKVKLMTIHSSKGLEFKNVYVVGIIDGLLPHKNIETMDDIEEERRLLYVAMTRAEDELTLSFFEVYQDKDVEKSIFIDELKAKDNPKLPWE